MTSRIPQRQIPAKNLKVCSSQPGPLLDLDTVHRSLVALGSPQLTIDELGRLFQGPMKVLLSFIVENVRGRHQTAVARSKLQQLFEAESSKHKMARSELGLTMQSEKRARSRLEHAKSTLAALQKQLDEKQASLAISEDKINKLHAELDSKRRVCLLLAMLEAKEKIRIQRFKEMAKLLDDFRNSVDPVNQNNQDSILALPETTRIYTPLTLPRINHTRDTLAALHAYHVHLSRLTSQSRGNEDGEFRLRQLLTKRASSDESDEQASMRLDKYLSLARSRAKRKVRYHGSKAGDNNPAAVVQIISAKEKELQRLSDLSIALGFLSMQHIDNISTFQTTTSQTLRSSLNNKASGVNDYVNILQSLISNSTHAEATDPFVTDVNEACGIRGNVANSYLTNEIEHVINTTHQRETFLANATLETVTEPRTQTEELIREYQMHQEQLNEKSLTLLRRKVAKVDNSLIKDIEKLIGEADMISSFGD